MNFIVALTNFFFPLVKTFFSPNREVRFEIKDTHARLFQFWRARIFLFPPFFFPLSF